MERETQRGKGGTNNKRAAVPQRGCQVQSGVGRQDSQGAVTGGESWETCVSCLPRLQTTSLCFTGPFFPSAHRQPPPRPRTHPPTSIHPPPPPRKEHNGATSIRAASRLQGWRGRGKGERRRDERVGEGAEVREREGGIAEKQTEEDGDSDEAREKKGALKEKEEMKKLRTERRRKKNKTKKKKKKTESDENTTLEFEKKTMAANSATVCRMPSNMGSSSFRDTPRGSYWQHITLTS